MTDDDGSGRTGMAGQVARFVVLGGVNTVVTSALFYGLSFWLRPDVAFTIVYSLGLAFVTLLTPRFVFGTSAGTRHRLALAAWYLAVYVCGLVAIHLLDEALAASREMVVVGTVALTAPLNFLGARWLVGPVAGPDAGGR